MARVAILRHPLPPRSLVHHFQNPSKGGSVTAAQSFTESPPPPTPTRSRYPRAPFGSRRPNSPIPPSLYPSISSGYTVAFRAFCGALNAQDSGVLVTTAQPEGCVCVAERGDGGDCRVLVSLRKVNSSRPSPLRRHGPLLPTVQRRHLSESGTPQPKPGRRPKCPGGQATALEGHRFPVPKEN